MIEQGTEYVEFNQRPRNGNLRHRHRADGFARRVGSHLHAGGRHQRLAGQPAARQPDRNRARRSRAGRGGCGRVRQVSELAVCRSCAGVDADGGVPCRVRTDGLPVSDDLCRRVRQLSERMAGGSRRVVPFAAAGTPDGGRSVQNHAQRRNHRRFAGKPNRTHRYGGTGRSTGRQRGAGAGEGCVWSTALCDGGTGFRRSVETGRRGVAGVAGGKYV